jgi:starch-binding outer membrane protein, SusD/RagB family
MSTNKVVGNYTTDTPSVVGQRTHQWRPRIRLTKAKFPIVISIIISLAIISCEKLIEIKPPVNSITNSQTFEDSINAEAALQGFYGQISNRVQGLYSSGSLTFMFGLYSDELEQVGTRGFYTFLSGEIPVASSHVQSIWSLFYNYIYHSNVIIEEVEKSKGISLQNKKQFYAEAKFLRSFIYSQLISCFGDLPYITSSIYQNNIDVKKTNQDIIYNDIIADLIEAKDNLPEEYKNSKNERVRPNTYAASALLSRIYLYRNEWDKAEAESKRVINVSSLYNLTNDPNDAFNKNSTETILQLFINNTVYPFNVISEGGTFRPIPGSPPQYHLREGLVRAFQSDDKRLKAWIDSINYQGKRFFFPKKYKEGFLESQPNRLPTQYYTMLRLAEQYLILSESLAQQNKLSEATEVLNIVRKRAGVNEYQVPDQQTLLDLILQERRKELMVEIGHRWFDMRRFGMAEAINKPFKPTWQKYKELLPIPFNELNMNPSLTQNPGY